MAMGHVGTFFGRKDQDKHYKLLSKFFADVCPMLGMAPRREKESPKLGHGAGRGRHFWGSGFFVSKTWIEPNLTSQLVHRDIFWLVVGNFFSIQLGISSSQLTNSYFSEGWVYHQPVFVILSGCFKISMISLKSLGSFQS